MTKKRPINITSNHDSVFDEIERRRKDLEKLWKDRLKKNWGSAWREKSSILFRKGEVSLIDVAICDLTQKRKACEQDVENFIQRVRNRNYSIVDVFTEFSCLEEAFNELISKIEGPEADKIGLIENLKSCFCSLFGVVLRETAEFYEHVIENAGTGFCQFDNSGRIIYANPELERITGSKKLIGERFEELFEGKERDLVRKKLSSEKHQTMFERLNLKGRTKNSIPVGIELAKVMIADKSQGGYAHMTDISRPIRQQNDVYDRLKIGIIRVNSDWKITFMNKFLLELLEIKNENWKGQRIESIVRGKENLKQLRNQLKERFIKGRSSEYEIELKRGKKKIPVKITAAPEKGQNNQVIRTIGIVQSITSERIHKFIETEKDPKILLKKVMEEIQPILPFERVYVVLYSSDSRHVRSYFHYSINGKPVTERRWYKITDAMKTWNEVNKIKSIPDIKQFYAKKIFANLKSDSAVKEIIKNFSSFIYYPIARRGRKVASVIFYSKEINKYQKKDERILNDLPLDSAVLMAIYHEEKKNKEFLLNLTKKIYEADDDLQKIANILVRNLASQYDWENVALFNARKSEQVFHLLGQRSSKEFRYPKNFTQSFTDGILGEVFRTKKPVNAEDIQKRKYKKIYKPTLKKTRSEMCIPIESGDLFWLLNIEDSRENAFSKDEENDLVKLGQDIKVFLERAWLRTFFEKFLISSSDAVYITDSKAILTRVNKAAINLLKTSEESLVGMNFADLFKIKDDADKIISANRSPNTRVDLISPEKKTTSKVIMAKFQLQEYFNTNVYVAKDISLLDRLEELEYLGKMYYEIAVQTQTPLTLIFAWLERLESKIKKIQNKEVLQEAIKQLKKIELTYNRLALYDKKKLSEPSFPYNEVLCSLDEIIDIIRFDFPKTEFERIAITDKSGEHYIEGDLFQLLFCFETVLSYLLRFLPQNEKIKLKVINRKGYIVATIEGFLPRIERKRRGSLSNFTASRSLYEMALGHDIIEKIVKTHKGSFREKQSGEKKTYTIALPSKEMSWDD